MYCSFIYIPPPLIHFLGRGDVCEFLYKRLTRIYCYFFPISPTSPPPICFVGCWGKILIIWFVGNFIWHFNENFPIKIIYFCVSRKTLKIIFILGESMIFSLFFFVIYIFNISIIIFLYLRYLIFLFLFGFKKQVKLLW